MLALALWQTVSDTFANKAASGGNVVSENTIAVHEQTDAYIAMYKQGGKTSAPVKTVAFASQTRRIICQS